MGQRLPSVPAAADCRRAGELGQAARRRLRDKDHRGQPRQIRVVVDTQRLAGYGLTPGAVVAQLQGANTRAQAGSFSRDNREFQVQAGLFFTTAEDLRQVVPWGPRGKARLSARRRRQPSRTAPPSRTTTCCLEKAVATRHTKAGARVSGRHHYYFQAERAPTRHIISERVLDQINTRA